jgi:PleD family two-component response regulator
MINSFQNSSFRDKETGLYNEAYFMEIFYREWHRLIRESHALSLLLIRPNLNIVNPEELKEYVTLAHLLDENTKRTTDLVSRFHHTEFIVGLFDLNCQGTTTIIERILTTIKHFSDDRFNGAKNTFISGVNIVPNNKVDINGVFTEVLSITPLDNLHIVKNKNDGNYELRKHQYH